MSDRTVANVVFSALEFCGVSFEDARCATVPIRSLGLLDEDLSFLLVPEIEERLGIKVPKFEWSNVETVGDLITMLQRYVP
ncbi:MAG TPA: acyl carrier protein [Longimicrobium sp.]|jgi:hypothetical protein